MDSCPGERVDGCCSCCIVWGGWCCPAERGSKAHGSKYLPRIAPARPQERKQGLRPHSLSNRNLSTGTPQRPSVTSAPSEHNAALRRESRPPPSSRANTPFQHARSRARKFFPVPPADGGCGSSPLQNRLARSRSQHFHRMVIFIVRVLLVLSITSSRRGPVVVELCSPSCSSFSSFSWGVLASILPNKRMRITSTKPNGGRAYGFPRF